MAANTIVYMIGVRTVSASNSSPVWTTPVSATALKLCNEIGSPARTRNDHAIMPAEAVWTGLKAARSCSLRKLRPRGSKRRIRLNTVCEVRLFTRPIRGA